jgi:hypothetical protein
LNERYGGRGASGNGGGVRCGWIGDLTIKGIGRSDLAGQDAPFWHSYGGCSLPEAIREAIWGDVYDAALPYGAVRVEAIITTGTQVPLHDAEDFGGEMCPRALILRRPFLRPAHYMRSMLFQDGIDIKGAVVGGIAAGAGSVVSSTVGPHCKTRISMRTCRRFLRAAPLAW